MARARLANLHTLQGIPVPCPRAPESGGVKKIRHEGGKSPGCVKRLNTFLRAPSFRTSFTSFPNIIAVSGDQKRSDESPIDYVALDHRRSRGRTRTRENGLGIKASNAGLHDGLQVQGFHGPTRKTKTGWESIQDVLGPMIYSFEPFERTRRGIVPCGGRLRRPIMPLDHRALLAFEVNAGDS